MSESRIHVLEVIGNAIVGGMETWVERFIERMPRERFCFTALLPFEGAFANRLRALDVDVVIVPMPDDPPWASIQIALALVNDGGIDLLHAHLPKAHLLAGLVGRLAGKPVVTTVHGRMVTILDLEVQSAVGSHLSVVCRQGYFHALGLGVNPAQLSCEPNGVDTAVFRPQRADGPGLRADLGLADNVPLLGYVGRLSPEKGPEVFVRAMAQMLGRHPEAHAVIVGEGPMQTEMTALTERLGVQQRLHFAGLRSDMPAVFNALDVVVCSSHSEAMPLALMEAMACGRPVVATRVGGVPDIVEHGQTGWLVAAGDVNDMAARCGELAADAALRRRMGELGRERVMMQFDLGQSVTRVSQLLVRLALPRAEGPRRVAMVASGADS